MKNTALSIYTLGLALVGFTATRAEAVDAFTDPVGYYTLNIVGASDNTLSLPMVRDAVFAGTVGNGVIGQNTFSALAGTVSPAWTAAQYQYRDAAQAQPQPQTYYVEFTSGSLKGLYYKIDNNGTDTLTLDTEGDFLNQSHTITGNATGSLQPGDSFKIRPYWRLKDVFEANGQPVIEAHPSIGVIRDSIMIPNYTTVGINKGSNVILYYLQGVGWQRSGEEGVDYGNFILRPNEAMIVRRLNAANVQIANLGGVLMNKTVSFIPGGTATLANDTYFSINRPAAVSLDNSGLSEIVTPAGFIGDVGDQVLAFPPGTGINRAPSKIYYFLSGQPAGQGWREAGADDITTVGQSVSLEPGKVYVLRKKKNTPGKDWVNNANY